jgi:hypothetical protein
MNTLKIFFIIFALLSVHGVAQVSISDSSLVFIETLYNSGQYLSAELEARRMLEQPGLNDSAKVQIDKWIAFSLIAQGKSSSAKERFISLLTIDGTFELDPVLTSPKILTVFNDARMKFISQKKNVSIDTVRSELRLQPDGPVLTFRTIIFPGWEQVHQGRETIGYGLLSGGVVALASGIAFEVLRGNARENYLKAKTSADISSKYDTYNFYRKAEVYSFAAFAAVYLASEIDVFTRSGVNVQPVFSKKNGAQMLLTVRF